VTPNALVKISRLHLRPFLKGLAVSYYHQLLRQSVLFKSFFAWARSVRIINFHN
jgi:hypothetical protein